MIIADYKTDTTRLATPLEVADYWDGRERRLARDRGWAPPISSGTEDNDAIQADGLGRPPEPRRPKGVMRTPLSAWRV